MSIMANHWVENDVGITLITLDTIASDFYVVDRRVNRVGLGLLGASGNILQALKNNLSRFIKLRQSIRDSKPDIVISFMDGSNILTLFATRGLGLKVIVSEHTAPHYHDIGKLWSWLRKKSYPWANAVIVLTLQVREWMEKNVSGSHVFVIPNPVIPQKQESNDHATLIDLISNSHHEYTVIAMGRLGPEKGFDMLITAFAAVAHTNSRWRLVILGEGKERDALEELSYTLGVTGDVFLPGRIVNPASYLTRADLYVTSSRYEGFPMALAEAMACALPVISFNCHGASELIRNGIDGLLVPPEDIDGLANAINRLMNDRKERKRLGTNAAEIIERYSVSKVMRTWDNIILELLKT